jgi:hypothetical protein
MLDLVAIKRVDAYFINAVDTSCPDKIGWCSSKTISPWKGAPWCPFQPSYTGVGGLKEHCINLVVSIDVGFIPGASCFNDDNCNSKYYFICEKPV